MTDRQYYKIYKIIQITFIKKGKFRFNTRSGINLDSQFLKSICSRYKEILSWMIQQGYMRCISQKYKVGGFQKKYSITEEGEIFYFSVLKPMVEKMNHRQKVEWDSGLNKSLQERFEKSSDETNIVYSLKDGRYHNSWTTVPRETRHNFRTHTGQVLLFDIDLKTGHPRMISETESLFRSEVEYQKWRELVLVDFYSFFQNEVESRDEVKKIVCCILNSNSKEEYTGNYKKVHDKLVREFPEFMEDLKEINDGKYYMGGIMNKMYESPIIWELYSKLKNSPLLKRLGITQQMIFDGIEIWGDVKLIQTQKDQLEKECSKLINEVLNENLLEMIKVEIKKGKKDILHCNPLFDDKTKFKKLVVVPTTESILMESRYWGFTPRRVLQNYNNTELHKFKSEVVDEFVLLIPLDQGEDIQKEDILPLVERCYTHSIKFDYFYI